MEELMDPAFTRALQRIPAQLRERPGTRFTVILNGNKKPEGKDWSGPNGANYGINDAPLAGYLAEGHNYGVLCGHAGITVPDLDDLATLTELGIIDRIPETMQARTGRGGLHLYLDCPELENQIGLYHPSLKDEDGEPLHLGEIQSKGQQVVGPGSIHPNGNSYEIINDAPILKISKADLLRIFDGLILTGIEDPAEEPRRAESRRRSSGGHGLGDHIPIDQVAWPKDIKERHGSEVIGTHPLHDSKGGKNFSVNTDKNCWHCFRHGSGGGPLEWLAVEAGLISCQDAKPGCLDKETFKKVLQIARDRGFDIPEPEKRRQAPNNQAANFMDIDFEELTEGGNAHRLERIHGDDMRFNHTHKKWYLWERGRWKVDGNGGAARLADDVVASLYLLAAKTTDSKERDRVAGFAKTSDSRKGIANMLALAANREKFALTAGDFDRDPWLLGAGEVTIDLKTCEAREPRREDFITMQAGAVYNSFDDCPLWKKFLKDIFAGNEDIIHYIKRAVGYCLTGSTSEQIFFFCYGTGANGKSVFLAVLRALMGEYAKQADFNTFLVQRNEKVRNDLAALAGARVITAVEAEEGGRLSMQVLKSWTGGDPITARFLFGENFTFKPQGKIWLAANTKPAITERNYAAWRRVHLVPFNVTIPPEERDPLLESKLIDELPGIFNWSLGGLRDYLKVGLKTPEAVAKATAEYRQENDSIESFIAECCELGKLKVCKNSELYPNYVNFCSMSGLTPLSQTRFSPEMNSKPGISSKKSKFGVEWKGLDLKPDWKPQKNETNPSPASGGPKGDDFGQNAERSLKSSLREGLCAFESNPSPNQSTDSDDGLSQPVTQDKTEPSKGSVVGGQKEGDEGYSVNILTDASKEDPGFQQFKSGMKKRTCCLCGRSFPYPLTPYFNKGQSGFICATCHMEGPPPEPEKSNPQTKLAAGA
jgi:putative DNA primase/helicase